MKLSHRGASQRWLPYACCGRQRSRSSRSAVTMVLYVIDKMSQERFNMKGSEGPTDVDLRKSGVFKSILLNLSPSCFHFVAICPYAICHHLASRQHPFLARVLAETVARDGQRWNIWNTAVFILRCPNICHEKRFVEQQSLPWSPKLRFSDL